MRYPSLSRDRDGLEWLGGRRLVADWRAPREGAGIVDLAWGILSSSDRQRPCATAKQE